MKDIKEKDKALAIQLLQTMFSRMYFDPETIAFILIDMNKRQIKEYHKSKGYVVAKFL